jgi:hypothetical protein
MEMAPIPSFYPPDLGKAPTTLYLAELSHGLLDGGGPETDSKGLCFFEEHTMSKVNRFLNCDVRYVYDWNAVWAFVGLNPDDANNKDFFSTSPSGRKVWDLNPINPEEVLIDGRPINKRIFEQLLNNNRRLRSEIASTFREEQEGGITPSQPLPLIVPTEAFDANLLNEPFGGVPDAIDEPNIGQQGIWNKDIEEKVARGVLYGGIGILTIVFLLARRALTKDRRY